MASAWAGLLLVAFLVSVAACGGKPMVTPAVITGKNAGVGESLQTEDWELTLIDQPYKRKIVGGLVMHARASGDPSIPSVCEAKGIYLIVAARLTNHSTLDELRQLPRDIFVVKDAQGREYQVAGRPDHLALIFEIEQWKSLDNFLVGNPTDPGQTREGPLIYDVAEDSTGLRMIAEGTEESVGLGF